MIHSPACQVRLARDADDVLAAQRLRYQVFVQELGGDGPLVDHGAGLERDRFDAVADHLLLIDPLRPPGSGVVGVYRLLQQAGADRIGQFASETEYDLTTLRRSGRRLLELGRSCLHPAYRGGMAMYQLWHGLAAYVAAHDIEVMFGVASFHGADPGPLAQALGYLRAHHLAPEALRVRSRVYQPMDALPPAAIDRRLAMQTTPALIKAYLRLGGVVGDGAYVDRPFNTVDVCLIVDIAGMSPAQRRLYSRPRPLA